MAAGQTSDHPSPEDFEEESPHANDHWAGSEQHSADPRSPSGDEHASAQPTRSSAPTQKRRRVTRACDECRRKKIKCDGKQPCTHCTVYSYDCSYDQPSNRRRNPTPRYIEALENRMQRAEAIIHTYLPSVDLNDPTYAVALSAAKQLPSLARLQANNDAAVDSGLAPTSKDSGTDTEKESLLESMVENTGSLDLDDKGHYDFHGHSSNLVFLRRMRDQFGVVMGTKEDYGQGIFKDRPFPHVFDSPGSSGDSPMEAGSANIGDLPSKECGLQLCRDALDEACVLMRFVHRPTFFAMFDRVYDIPPDQWGNEENRYLPLVYAIMAVGTLFGKSERSRLQREGYATAIDSGFIFFKASRQMMDITDCRDLPSLQAVIFMIMFLQSSATLSTCYAYIGVALHSAVRMGLHRRIAGGFNLIEAETRKRMFWQIRKMDIYVGAMLGLPMMLSDDDIDQEVPLEIDDQYILPDRILPFPPDQVMLTTATNAHTTLVRILQKSVKYIYPIKTVVHAENKSAQTYMVSHAKIREIERDLQGWMENLAMGLRPGGEVSPQLLRVQQLLRMGYAHVQMMLYRPFLHYVSNSLQTGAVDKRSYACAAACVSVSRNIIHITAEMNKRGSLVGSYWFVMYTTFFAILSLVFFVLENPESQTSQGILKDAQEGKDILAHLARKSLAADRCTAILATVFRQLPDSCQRGRLGVPSPTSPKRRHASSPRARAPAVGITNAAMVALANSEPAIPHVSRASTFPNPSDPSGWKTPSRVYPNAADTFRRNSHEIYPSSSPSLGDLTPDTMGSGPAPHALGHANAGLLPHNFGTAAIPDLSAVMFPSADPFAYPNQPMTTLEDHNFIKPDPGYGPATSPPLYSPSSTSGPGTASYDHMEAQLFGPLPPYLMQGQQASLDLPGADLPLDGGVEMSLGDGWPVPGQGPSQATGGSYPTISLDEILGEEWKGAWGEAGFGGCGAGAVAGGGLLDGVERFRYG